MLSSETGSTGSNGTPRKSPAQSPKPSPQLEKINPLEKIEQLLTCSICLDRYKNPKLLPCQHTYCLPCLDNYVDTIHHNLKCPECRSEHSIPYDGAKGFPTNLTLTSFLDIHLEATDDHAEQIEAYINRYNMERCKICDEKAELELCYHCDRKTCKECRNAHMEMIKRDLSRLLNQIRRLSNRVKEASDGVSKNIKQLDSNISSTETEIRDYFQRYQAELKKREEHFLGEVELFGQNEKRLMQSVRDVLEAEHKNLADSCTWVESALDGSVQVKDDELCRYKTVIVDAVENLRNFQPDSEDMFSKKVRFSPGDDASKLPTAICNFGELSVLLPQFAGRYLPIEQHYLPKSLRLGLESDSYKTSLRMTLEESQLKSSKYKRPTDDTFNSTRSRRPLQLDDDSNSRTSRLRVGPSENGRSSPLNSTNTSNATPSPLFSRSPIHPASTSTIVTELEEPAGISTKNSSTPNLLDRRGQNRSAMILPDIKPSASNSPKKEQTKEKQASAEEKPKEEPADIRLRQKPPLPRQQSSNDSNEPGSRLSTPTLVEQATGGPKRRSLIIETTSSSATKSNGDSPTVLTPTRRQKFKIICRSTSSNPPMKRSDSADSLDLAAGTLTSTLTTTATPRPSNGEPKNDPADRGSGVFATSLSSNFSNYPTSPTIAAAAAVAQTVARLRSQDPLVRMDSNGEVSDESPPLTPKSRSAWLERRRQKFLRSRTNPDIFATMDPADRAKLKASTNTQTPTALSARVQQLLNELEFKNALAETSTPSSRPSSTLADVEQQLTDSRSRLARRTSMAERDLSTERTKSRTRPTSTLLSTPLFDYGTKSKPRVVFGRRGDGPGEMNWPRGIAILPGGELATVDSANHRVQIFNKNGKFLRQFGAYGKEDGKFDNCAAIAYNRNKQQILVSDRYNNRIQIFDLDGKFVKAFGSAGTENGKFKEPWGIAVDELGLIYVVDKGNHRVQVFGQNGQYMSKFGSKGDGIGQFNHPLYIAIHRRTQNLFVSDTGNNRICVHDHDGVAILNFGVEGFHTGQLKLPRGVVVDDQGFVTVADSGNNRIQIFSPEGQFHYGFGNWGANLGQLKGVEGVALLDGDQIVVSDRENHRLQIF